MDERAKERVAIAKDALAQIASGAVRVEAQNSYVRFPGLVPASELDKPLIEVMQGTQCEVCAKGSLLLGYVSRNRRDMTVRDTIGNVCQCDACIWEGVASIDGSQCNSLLQGVFDRQQIDMMEDHFERYVDGPYKRIADARERLEAILNNVIVNEGEFIPPCALGDQHG